MKEFLPKEKLAHLNALLLSYGPKLIACSGGLDSLLLAFLSHKFDPAKTLVVHGANPGVPEEALSRLKEYATREQWKMEFVTSGEFEDPAYLTNPHNRCYFCKQHLYKALSSFLYSEQSGDFVKTQTGAVEPSLKSCQVLSGANTDDLGEYRPGLQAAKEAGVRHPFIEAGISKSEIREICRLYNLDFAELPASPCLASRLYTGTAVTPRKLRLVDEVEMSIKQKTGIAVVRGRLKDKQMLIEVLEQDREKLSEFVIRQLKERFVCSNAEILDDILVDPVSYRPGRSFMVPE